RQQHNIPITEKRYSGFINQASVYCRLFALVILQTDIRFIAYFGQQQHKLLQAGFSRVESNPDFLLREIHLRANYSCLQYAEVFEYTDTRTTMNMRNIKRNDLHIVFFEFQQLVNDFLVV